MKNTIYFSFLFFLFSAALPAQNNRFYVSASASGAANGSSWADAFIDLQAALQIAQWGDTVWVAEGTYYPGTGTQRTQSFEPLSGVKIFGGFAGTESSIDQRDWAAHPVVLSGDIGTPGDSLDNCYNVVYLFQPDSNTVLDGLVIRDGVANYDGAAPSRDRRLCGGGLYIEGTDWEAYPDIRNCRFEHNSAYNFGGGMMVNGSGDGSVAPRVVNCVFSGNYARAGGGGMAKFGGSWVERGEDLTECIFERNITRFRGGGYYYADSERNDSIQISQCRFTHNMSALRGGGIFMLTGREQGSILSIDHTDFMNNIANNNVAIDILPQGFALLKKIDIFQCKIGSNKDTLITQVPGGIFQIDQLGTENSFIRIENFEFFDNQSTFFEAFSTAVNCNFIVTKCKFTNNTTRGICSMSNFNNVMFDLTNFSENTITSTSIFFNFGGNNFISINNTLFKNNQTTSPPNEPFLQIENIKYIKLFNNTFALNEFAYIDDTNVDSPSEFIASNCVIISLPGYDFLNHFDSSATITNCYFNTLDCSDFPPNYTCSNLITGIDPLFVNPDSFDFRLQPCSPLVNAGNNAFAPPGTDLAGLPRILGGTVDIGAYETALPTLAAQPGVSPACPGTASGSAAFEVAGGCPPFDYAWSNSAGGSGTGAGGLVPGDYTFTITDARGSAFTATLSVPPGSPIALTPAPTPLLCGDTLGGSAAMSVAQAHPPIQFLWDDGSTDSLRTPLAPGNYAITVTDAIGCTAAGTIEVGITGNLGIDISVQEISCHGAADGALNILPANGVPPFQWLWAGGDTSATLQPIGPGQYAGTLTDAYGCTIGWYVPLGQPDSLIYSAQLSPSSSPPAANGSILLSDIAGGTQPYAILWSNGDIGPLADSLPAGPHAMTLTDAHGCAYTAVFNLGTSGTTSAADAPAGFDLLPNPARDVVWVLPDAPALTEMPLLVHDASGRLRLRQTIPAGTSRWPIPVADWPRGALWVQLWDGKRWQTRVVTVQ